MLCDMNVTARVAILGVTGFIGRGMPARFADKNWAVTGISRSGRGNVAGVDSWQTPDALDFSGHDAVINLAGEPIAKRWTEANKIRFHESRIGVTKRVVAAIASLPSAERPRVLVNTSAVGIYGNRGDEILTEESTPGNGYLADLCREWEAAALEAEALGVRVIRLRVGIVLGRDGDAFKQLLLVFKSGIGGKLGSGRQWMPWVHVDDLREAISHSVLSAGLSGAVNGCAPAAERNADFTRKLASALRRPAIFPVPGFALKIALGGFGGALLEGQHAKPTALESDGFAFRFPTLESALADLIG